MIRKRNSKELIQQTAIGNDDVITVTVSATG